MIKNEEIKTLNKEIEKLNKSMMIINLILGDEIKMNEKDKVIQELLERIANLERNIEEVREFLVHSSISIEDMKRVDEIFGS